MKSLEKLGEVAIWVYDLPFAVSHKTHAAIHMVVEKVEVVLD
jgi:hypothetical protein